MAKKTSALKLPAHEHMRVVPLHQPKVRVKLGAKTEDSELFNGRPHAIPETAELVYGGGPLLTNVEVFVIYWGTQFSTGALKAYPAKIDAFFDTILTSSLMDQMKEYSVKGKEIGHGRRVGSIVITKNAPTGHITDSQIRKQLLDWIDNHPSFPKRTKNTLYFIYFEHGVAVSMGGSRSCSSFCGYHDAIRSKTFYAVMPFPGCSGCLGDMNAFDALCGTSSHELCEAVTDPIPGAGWYDPIYGEIGDICAWRFKKVKGYTVQLEWSNAKSKCI